ncbi:MAG: hypothetical protein C7B45_00210 [Sulfobacillus acidophilus]|uniref:Uncharacterized protein n=1 Tax=Sulfobacillus acidophilus TaxID=53633 RepID=A0A2T2WPB6_9FIRM|nr:MAG: hypothetical protein C7B45_00210 [Sulfobacillus acidophilus]
MMLTMTGLLTAAVLALVGAPWKGRIHGSPPQTRKVAVDLDQIDDFVRAHFCMYCGARRRAERAECSQCGWRDPDSRSER